MSELDEGRQAFMKLESSFFTLVLQFRNLGVSQSILLPKYKIHI